MPPKRGKTTTELSRSQVLAKYGLTDATLRRVTEGLHLVDLPVTTRHGRCFYSVDKDADKALQICRLDPYSTAGRRWPAHRYIAYSLMLMPAEEVYEEIQVRGIGHRGLTVKELKRIEKGMVDAVPAPLKAVLKTKAEPKTPAQTNLFEILLDVIGMRVYYHAPAHIDETFFDDENVRELLNQVILTSGSSYGEKADELEKVMGAGTLSASALGFYAHVFFDHTFMRDREWASFCKALPPRVGDAYQRAESMSVEDFMVHSRVERGITATYEAFSRVLQRRVMDLSLLDDPTATSECVKSIRMLMSVQDRLGYVGGKKASEKPTPDAKVPAFLGGIAKVKTYDFDAEFRVLEDAPERETSDGGA